MKSKLNSSRKKINTFFKEKQASNKEKQKSNKYRHDPNKERQKSIYQKLSQQKFLETNCQVFSVEKIEAE